MNPDQATEVHKQKREQMTSVVNGEKSFFTLSADSDKGSENCCTFH